MRYLSVCSGIEAATVAWHPLGWEPVAFAEIERFPSAVLAHHYPSVPNLGDMTKLTDVPAIDLLVGGTPCQSFSVAGLRGGMADPRGNLALVYLGLADRLRPRWIVWENVPGVLSSSGGRDFGAFLGGLAQLGYGFAYRVLDAQFFGLAQRRKRVFVVGHLGDWRRAAAVLLERSGVRWDPPPSRAAGEDVAGTLEARAGSQRGHSDFTGGRIARSLNGHHGRSDGESETFVTTTLRSHPYPGSDTLGALTVTHALRADGFDASEDGTGRGTPLVTTFDARQDPVHSVGVSMPLGARDTGHGIATRLGVRRLTPLECERLQGFPTRIERVIIHPCYDRDGTRLVRVALRCLSAQSDALPVGEQESAVGAQFADASFWNDRESLGAAVALHVRHSHEPKALRVLSRGRLLWSAKNAGADATFPLPTRADATARAVAALAHALVAVAIDGRAESRPSISGSTHPASGSSLVVTFGPENEVAASDVLARMDKATKYTTSESGRDSQLFGLSARTLLSCVCLATSGFTARPTYIDHYSAVVLDLETDYTAIPGAKDGPRYKALGNSMAVPVMRWIGQRIATA